MKIRFLISAVTVIPFVGIIIARMFIVGGKTEGFVENFGLGLVTGGLVGALVAGGIFFVFWKKIINF